ncbi:TPA: SLOG family protein [Bacillus cereus]|uniref:SLOG family protein n=1 Tax=Bacillus sp. ISTL8 TaxID=2596896 RepID=UPI0014567F24|nr:SLOG family protein [Bacillus sp. ISTL8]
MVKVIVAGSREFKDYSKMANTLIAYFMNKSYSPDDVEIISGTAGGADKLGERFADKAGCKLTRMPADWDGLGKKAGYIRNWDMAKYAGSDGVCFCFWDGKSKGTKHMIDLARKEGLEVHVIIFS